MSKKPKLTLEEIRKGLLGGGDSSGAGGRASLGSDNGASGRKSTDVPTSGNGQQRRRLDGQDEGGSPLESHRSSAGRAEVQYGEGTEGRAMMARGDGDDDEEHDDYSHASLESLGAAFQKLSQLAEQVAVYCQLLERSRLRAADETQRLQKTSRVLEAFLETAPQRQSENLEMVKKVRDLNQMLDSKYRKMKVRAKELIDECTEEKDRLTADHQKANSEMQTSESRLLSLQTLLSNQRKQMEQTREMNLTMHSPRELAEIDIKLRELATENEEMRNKKKALEATSEQQSRQAAKLVASNTDPAQEEETIRKLEKEIESARKSRKEAAAQLNEELEGTREDVEQYHVLVKELQNRYAKHGLPIPS